MNSDKLRACLVAALVVCAAGTHTAQEEPASARRYLVEQGVYEVEKSSRSAGVEVRVEETVYFEDWGATEVRFTTTRTRGPRGGQGRVQRLWTLREEGSVTMVDLDRLTGTRTAGSSPAFLGGPTAAGQGRLGGALPTALGGRTRELEPREHLGRTCTVSETSSELGSARLVTTTWTWKNIVMRVESTGLGSVESEIVTRLELGASIPPKKRRLPEGARIKEVRGLGGGLEGYRRRRS